MTTPPEPRRQYGFAIVSAIFILVALSVLGAFVALVSTTQQAGSALDLAGSRAYYAARAGTEWGMAQTAPPTSACAASTTIAEVNGFTVTVQCAALASGADEAGLGHIYSITATACNQPAEGACPRPTPGANYVERRVSALIERDAP